jgi:hypothetical protein
MKKRKIWYKFLTLPKNLVEKKKYLEFFTALLSIPVLITVIVLNLNSVNNLKDGKPTEAPKQGGSFFSIPIDNKKDVKPSPLVQLTGTAAPCKKELGPVDIENPEENETISDNPVSVIISYPDDEYCPAVWAYRINGGGWSDYDNKSIALYNLPNGKVKFELKVKSLVKNQEKTITRNFAYKGTPTTVAPTVIIDETDELGTSSAR